MIETTIADFIGIVKQMDRETFCLRIRSPVLVPLSETTVFAFQARSTAITEQERMDARDVRAQLQGDLPVLEVASAMAREGDMLTVGRSEDNDLVIADETVSGQHARLMVTSRDTFTVEDLKSRNGTWVNNLAIHPGLNLELANGDVLMFGDAGYLFYYPDGLYDLLHDYTRQ